MSPLSAVASEPKHTPGPWSPEPPGRGGGRSWHVTRLNSRALMNIEYLMGPRQARKFRTQEAAQAAADKANAATGAQEP